MHIVERLLETAYQDTQLLEKRKAMGDILSLFHTVDFCLGTDDGKQANTVCSFISDNQYGTAHVEENEGAFRIITIVETPITESIICSLSANMVSLSYMFNVDYIGWGSCIETGDQA